MTGEAKTNSAAMSAWIDSNRVPVGNLIRLASEAESRNVSTL
jgi:hypothetical protein